MRGEIKAYLIGGEYDGTIVILIDRLPEILMIPQGETIKVPLSDTFGIDMCQLNRYLKYVLVYETPHGRLIYELQV